MMRPIGFSTGSLAKEDFNWAVGILLKNQVSAIELSALRYKELEPLIGKLDELDLSAFKYISFHAPSKFDRSDERKVVHLLHQIKERKWPIIVHPDVLFTPRYWKELNGSLCIENMDMRKSTGRTMEELEELFRIYPHSSLCFDIAHAKQIDGTMAEAASILCAFHQKIKQIHISEVDVYSNHHPINSSAIKSYQKVCDLIPGNTPVILESPSIDDDPHLKRWIHCQIEYASSAVTGAPNYEVKQSRRVVRNEFAHNSPG